jgi:hypothetical protein
VLFDAAWLNASRRRPADRAVHLRLTSVRASD